MKTLKALSILFVALIGGYLMESLINYPIPDMIYAFLLLFLAMYFKLVRADEMELVSKPLIRFMPLFLVPPTVRILYSFDLLKENFFKLFLVLSLSLLLSIISVAYVVNFLRRKIND